jgi:hypothetical protein
VRINTSNQRTCSGEGRTSPLRSAAARWEAIGFTPRRRRETDDDSEPDRASAANADTPLSCPQPNPFPAHAALTALQDS